MQIGWSLTKRAARTLSVYALGLGVVAAHPADAQMRAWEETGYLNINFAYQASSRTFQEVLTEQVYGELATFTGTHNVGGGGAFDVGGGVRVWRNLAIGVAITSISTSDGLLVDGQVPHPLFFERNRTGSFARADLEHQELGVHVHGMWVIPLSETLQVSLFGGPSFFNVDQDGIADVERGPEVGPPLFAEVTLTEVSTVALSGSGVGVNAGVDFAYMVTEQFGGGLFVRWAGGAVDIPAAGGTESLGVGGFQTGLGVRVRF